jgi:hypothetical protein
MRKSLLSLILISLLPSCGGNVEESVLEQGVLDEHDDLGAPEKADGLVSTATYYTARRDLRRCAYPACGGLWVKRANRAETLCANGQYAAECYVAETDFTASGLIGESASAFGNLLATGRGVARGSIVRKYFSGFGYFGVLRSVPISAQYDTGVWRAASETASTQPFRLVESSGIRCVTTPCPSLHQAWLNINSNVNPTYHTNLIGLDLRNVAASVADKQRGGELAMQRLLVQAPAPTAVGQNYALTATQFYLPFQADAPTSCVTDGCSGQICRDASAEPVFTTCDWRPEYACYQQYGHCERQADGACGWSQTRDFLACLQNPPTP